MNKENKRAPHPIDIHVGSRVRLRRMMQGISQEKLGEDLGLTFQQVQKYEKGVNRIGAGRLFEIAQILDVPVQFFYDDFQSDEDDSTLSEETTGYEAERTDLFASLATSDGMQLAQAFLRINDVTIRRRIVDLVKAIAEPDSAGTKD